MRAARILILVGLLALLLAPAAIVVVGDRKKSGRKLTDAPIVEGAVGTVTPAALARQASLPVDVYTAARIAASEAGNRSELEQAAVIWVARNQARHLKKDLTSAATMGKTGAGFYGSQSAGGRWIATSKDPTEAHAAIALAVLGGEIPDPTGGARRFFHVASQDALNRRDPAKWRPSAAIVDKWRGEGFSPRKVGSIPTSEFLVFVDTSDYPVGVA
jgi:hypothetical protein